MNPPDAYLMALRGYAAGAGLARAGLKADRTGYLRRFYLRCFPLRPEFRIFKETLLDDYCNTFGPDRLNSTLDYLENTNLDANAFSGIKSITVIHGENVKVSPAAEAEHFTAAM